MHHRSHDWGGLHPDGLHLGSASGGGWRGAGPPSPGDIFDTTGYGQQASGTHPTGMYSFSYS